MVPPRSLDVLVAILFTALAANAGATPQVDRNPVVRPPAVTCLAVLTDGVPLIGRNDGYIVTFDPRTGTTVRQFARHASGVTDIAVDPRGEFVAASSSDGRVALWPVKMRVGSGPEGYPGDDSEPAVILRPKPEVWRGPVQVEWTHDGKHLVTWSFDWLHGTSPTTVQLWSRAGDLVWTGPHARQVSVHPTRDCIAVVVADEVLLGWPGEDLRTIELEGAYDAVEFSPDGSKLAVGGRDFRVWILDAESGATNQFKRVTDVDPMQMHEYILRLRWSPGGRWLGVMAAKGCNPAILDASDLGTAWAGGLLGARMWSVFDVAWTPDGRMLTGFGDVMTVDPGTGETQHILAGAEIGELVGVDGSGDILLVASGALRRVDPRTGKETWIRHERAYGAAALSEVNPMYGALRHVQLLSVSEESPPILRLATAYRTASSGASDGRIAIFERPAESTAELGAPAAVLKLAFDVLPLSTATRRVQWKLVELDEMIVAVVFDASKGRLVLMRFPDGKLVATLDDVRALEDARGRSGNVEVLVRTATTIDRAVVDVESKDVARAFVMGAVDAHTAASFVATDHGKPALDEAVVASFDGIRPIVRRIKFETGHVSRFPIDVEGPSFGDLRVAAWGRGPLRRTEGFLNSVFKLMDVDPIAPDRTTLSRRSPGPRRCASPCAR